MNLVFLDTSYVLAVQLANDQDHARASEHWRRIEALDSPPTLVTTTDVFNEIVTFLKKRRQHDLACAIGNYLLTSTVVRLTHVDEDLFEKGWTLLQQQSDKTYSLTDCISFVLMQQLGIHTAYTFDHHFRQAGFDVEP